jgi:hypothetical protein
MTNREQLIDQIIDELQFQCRTRNSFIDLAKVYEWVAKRLHRYKDVQEACEYYFEFA